MNIRRQHGTASTVSATHKWCRSVQVYCWAVHMWMWENCKDNSLTQNENAVVQISLPVTQSKQLDSEWECSCTDQSASHPKRCVDPPPPHVQTTPAASALLNSLVQFFWTSQQCEQQIFSLADPQQSSQSQRTFFVMRIKKRSREITLQTSAINVYKSGKTICLLH